MKIDDIWVINLNKEKSRWENIKKTGKGLNIHRWIATYGKQTTIKTAEEWGVDTIISMENQKDKILSRNSGVVGCWMSHKRLLHHLAQLDVPDNHGHLIVEDDIDLYPELLDNFRIVSKQIPRKWDMVYLSIMKPVGTRLSSRIIKAESSLHSGNWGTHAYMVRHGSIKKILKHLRFMANAIDIQYNYAFDELDVYIIEPGIIKLNSELAKISTVTIS